MIKYIKTRKDGTKMKKAITVTLSIIFCMLSFALPSFALTSNDFEYEIVDEKVVIIGYNGTNTTLTIPAEIDGVTVSKIGDNAFADNTAISSVTVSDGIEDIGTSAFENCTSLATITLPETIIHIGEKAIHNTAYYNDTTNWRLKRTDSGTSGGVNVGNGNASIDWEDIGAPVLQYLYLGKNLIEIELVGSYSLKSGTLVVADGAFKGNSGATDVGFPSSIVTIGNNAFEGCTKLNSVRNLEYVDNIGDYAFKDCVSLENITISEMVNFNSNAIVNTGFYNNSNNWENNVLYMGTRVVSTHKIEEIVIKDGTTDIISGALSDTNVVIPTTVVNIQNDAFISTDKATVFGYSNSYAQTYANRNLIPFVALDTTIKGDVNFDGKLNVDDYKILLNVSALKQKLTYAIALAGDMNEDNAIDGFDVVILDLILNDIGPSTIKGDADGNGEVNELDYELLVKISSSQAEITNNYMFHRCDINDDGAVDNFDAIYLDLALNGLVAII